MLRRFWNNCIAFIPTSSSSSSIRNIPSPSHPLLFIPQQLLHANLQSTLSIKPHKHLPKDLDLDIRKHTGQGLQGRIKLLLLTSLFLNLISFSIFRKRRCTSAGRTATKRVVAESFA